MVYKTGSRQYITNIDFNIMLFHRISHIFMKERITNGYTKYHDTQKIGKH